MSWKIVRFPNAGFLKINNPQLGDWRSLSVAGATPPELKPALPVDYIRLKTRIVYFINCYVNPNYMYLFRSQMRELVATRLLTHTAAILYVVSSGSEADRLAIAAELGRPSDLQNVRHEHVTENAFEYPGIRKAWQLGREDQDAYVLYFHARGLSRIKLGRFRRNRQPAEKRLFKRVISEWRQNLTWLEHLPAADKVGLTCGGNGWIWYNFWWARASYLAHLEEPVKTDRRHYYEDWLGRYAGRQGADYQPTLDRCIAVASSRCFKKYNLGSDFYPRDGGTYLGLPWGTPKLIGRRMLNSVKKLLGRPVES